MRRWLDSPWPYYLGAALLLVLLVVSVVDVQVPSRGRGDADDIRRMAQRDDLNVLFILVDTLRADHLGMYGYERDTSPILDDLASVAVRFDDTIAQSSWTKCSMASLWTGNYPAQTGVTRYKHSLSEAALLPAEIFKAAGYRTAGVYRNGWVAPNFGFGQGFDVYAQPVPKRTAERFEQRRPGDAPPLTGTDIDVTETATAFVRAHQHEKFFLYVHYMDVHQYLYSHQSALFGTRYMDSYDNAIHWTDRNIGLLLATFHDLGLLEKTVVILASDHGEAFHEHGVEGHARNLYREVVHTPFLISFPFRLENEVVVRSQVRNIDIWPTVLDLVGLPEMEGVEGRSLVPLMLAAAEGKDESLHAPPSSVTQLDQTWGRVSQEPKPLVSLERDGYRILYPVYAPALTEFFHTAEDVMEQDNVASEEPERVAEFTAAVMRHLEEAGDGVAEEVSVDSMDLRQLRALGYAIE